MGQSILSRERLGTQLSKAGVLGVLRPLHDGFRKPITVLAYHRVLPRVDPELYPFDLGLVSATPDEFDWQMALVRREFDPIALSDIGHYVRGRFKLPRRPIVVTFDDGYEDNYQHAFPILRRHGVPATVFATVGHIGTSNLLWHDWAAYLTLRASQGEIPTLAGPQAISPTDSVDTRRRLVRQFLSYLKSRPHAEMIETLAMMRERHAASIRADELVQARPLSWEQVRVMADAGVQFGSHTMTHSILSRLGPDELREELTQSKAVLEQKLNTPCDSIAYPVGRRFAYTPSILAEVGLTGYRLGLAYDAGTNWAHALNLFALQRQSIELETSRDYFRAMVNMPRWFH